MSTSTRRDTTTRVALDTAHYGPWPADSYRQPAWWDTFQFACSSCCASIGEPCFYRGKLDWEHTHKTRQDKLIRAANRGVFQRCRECQQPLDWLDYSRCPDATPGQQLFWCSDCDRYAADQFRCVDCRSPYSAGEYRWPVDGGYRCQTCNDHHEGE